MKLFSESFWGDVHKRSRGDEIRKEDDVNHLDVEGFVDYLEDRYEANGDPDLGQIGCWYLGGPSEGVANISIPIEKNDHNETPNLNNRMLMIRKDVQKDEFEIRPNKYIFRLYPNELKKTFGDDFDIDASDFKLIPYSGKITNQMCVDVIDKLLGMVERPILIKKVTESFWGDVHRRSRGDEVRKEDEMSDDDLNALDDFIFGFATRVVWDGMKVSLTNFLKYIEQNPEALDCDIDRVKKYVEDNWHKSICDDVEAAIEQEDKEKEQDMNESFWGDVHKRSRGDEVRKEDDLNLLDVDGLYNYVKEMYAQRVFDIDLNVMHGFNGWTDCLVYPFDDVLSVSIARYSDTGEIRDIAIVWDEGGIQDSFMEKLEDRYDVNNLSESYITVTEKDGSISNRTFINLLDFILENEKKDVLYESFWGDVHRRSRGDEIRKEDHIDLLDPDGFVAYIRKIYRVDNAPYDIENRINGLAGTGVSNIFIPICSAGTKNIKIVAIYFDYNREVVYAHSSIKKYIPKLWAKLDQDFDLWDDDPDYRNFTIINPKDTSRKVNNSYVLELLDYICDNLDDNVTPCLFRRTNESFWGDVHKRSRGDEARKEDDFSDVLVKLEEYIQDYAADVVNEFGRVAGDCTLNAFVDYLINDKNASERVIQYTKDNWDEKVFDNGQTNFEQYISYSIEEEERGGGVRESFWGDVHKRSRGDSMRKEDEVLSDMEINSLNEFTLMYCRKERAHYIQNHIVPPPPSGRKENDYEGLIKYIEDRRDENRFTNVGDYNKIIRFIKKNWDKLNMDKYIKKHICTPDIMNGKKLVECDGAPGGLTPADVGGMGPAYFPGPNGEPGSGDLPSPTGVVYHQVAPYTMFLKDLKKKKKKKKFRIEDEPCAHSKNSKVYNYVDDFREYVDRTYNNIDRRK